MFEPRARQAGKSTAARRVAAAAASVSIEAVRVTPAVIAAMMGRCMSCRDTGYVCENHPELPWAGVATDRDACDCGAGMPCACCESVPEDGTHSIVDAFTPRKFRRVGDDPGPWSDLGHSVHGLIRPKRGNRS